MQIGTFSASFFFIFVFSLLSTANKKCGLTGFELQIFGSGSNRSTSCATITAQYFFIVIAGPTKAKSESGFTDNVRSFDAGSESDCFLEVPICQSQLVLSTSVTRVGDFLNFGQLFKAFGNQLFAQFSYFLRHFL